jgi:monovalent cation/hydrogen antiporter
MSEIALAVYLVVGVVIVNGLAGRIGVPAPILLVLVGFAVSFIPGVPDFQVNPEFVLTVLLPPLLYAGAVYASVIAIRRLIRPILQLAVGMVIVTAFAVALVLTWLVPEMPFAAALAVGAIVAPPDAVAAVAVARRVGMPQHVVTVLEGESLLNDATALVLLRVAVVGMAAGSMEWGPAVGEFAWATAGGLLAGGMVGPIVSLARRRISSSLAITALSLVTPFLTYHLGELIEASGVLAVVVSGLILGFRGATDLQPEVRMTLRVTWATVRYMLEGTVFALIGLQLWAIITAPDVQPAQLLVVSLAVLLTVILIRPAWIFLMRGTRYLFRRKGLLPDWQSIVAVSWAGMRGVVSLAAAQTLPLQTPYRSLLLTCTIAVIVGTLVLQGLSLPVVIRALHFPGDPMRDRIREKDAAIRQANKAIGERIETLIRDEHIAPAHADRIRTWVRARDLSEPDDGQAVAPDAQLGDGSPAVDPKAVGHWAHELMAAERQVFIRLRNSGDLSEESLRELEFRLDLEEAVLDSRVDDATGHLENLRVVRQDREDEPD